METDPRDTVQVGCVPIPLATATQWIREYTDVETNRTSERPYAFPAYDRYDGGTTDPGTLTDGDLLAPVLLNVQVKVRTFYGLQNIRERLEEGLRAPVLAEDLAAADPEPMAEAVRTLYSVSDEQRPPWGVQGTTLSKVLHRKRPQSLVLHDTWVWGCYVGGHRPSACGAEAIVGRLHGPGDRSHPGRHREPT